MLLIKMVRDAGSTEESASYTATVYINARRIWQGTVENHVRADGWAILAIKLARKAFLGPEQRHDLTLHCCPACGKGLKK